MNIGDFNCLLGLSVEELERLLGKEKKMNVLREKIRAKIIEAKENLQIALINKDPKMSEQCLGEIKAYEEVLKMIDEE